MIRFGAALIGKRERRAVNAVLLSGELTRGDECYWFEHELTLYLGKPTLAVSSGTAALHLALLGVGVQPGDEVILPATTFVATVNAVLYCGATPVVVDVDPKSWTISIDEIRRAISPRTKAILPVHLYGVPADMGAIQQVVDQEYRSTGRRIAIVEDAAEAFGAMSYGKAAGTVGDVGAFSFYGSKTITTGEGGAVTWSDPLIGLRVRHVHGQSLEPGRRYWHDSVGFNYRMTEVQAAIGAAQLTRLGEFLDKRKQVFDWYDARLPEKFRRQRLGIGDTHGYWAFAVWSYALKHDEVAARMLDDGVETRPIFPPVTLFRHVCDFAKTPATAMHLHDHGIVLPTHCGLTEEDVDKVCHALEKAVSCS